MVTAERIRAAVAAVPDPEIRVVTIAELGILREVSVDGDGSTAVTITPTYVGCPAMDTIRADIRAAARRAGAPDVRVDTVWSPAWTTRWIGEEARAKLAAAGIAPPGDLPESSGDLPEPVGAAPAGTRLLPLAVTGTPPAPACPRCGGRAERLARFGSTACKSLWRCESCGEPFDHFKEH
ncbi:1,2-phenylacetyl-CoA epoxidase subunit PaaD [Streptomyces alanosinicus]|uniref:Phenylacetic acid degradation protein PaaD n=1 Tax=Streptomyces alanosinicus TaxID=68171 RepID=A0A918YSX7_9ACTN|nr:1,2-phenylacetyl-CoA epoxidase subunit PaaD [Streptomyces alanosinicus]GHE12647.1 phenylacetic acid degradation protein PaaD [Streptomyces alanosinicus]